MSGKEDQSQAYVAPDDAFLSRHQVTRSMIEHENVLIGIRLGWMIACQGLLITALGLGDFELLLKIGVSLLGALVSVFSFRNVYHAQLAVRSLKNSWPYEYRTRHDRFPDVIGLRGGEMGSANEIFTPPAGITMSFFVFWVGLASYYAISFNNCYGNSPLWPEVIGCPVPPPMEGMK